MALVPGLNSYSYHLAFALGEMTEDDLLRRAAALGLRSVELGRPVCCLPEAFDAPRLGQLRGLADGLGLACRVSGFAPLLAQGDEVEQMEMMLDTQLRATEILGASVLRFDGMLSTRMRINEPKPVALCAENLRRVLARAAEVGVVIALENHMDFTTDEFLRLLDAVDSPDLMVTLDTGNMLPLLEPLLPFIAAVLPRIVNVHFKGLEFVWSDGGAVLTSSAPEQSIVDLEEVLRQLQGTPQQVTMHIEVVAMDRKREQQLVEAYVDFLRERIPALFA